MVITIVDALIILFILFGAFVGYSRGVVKQAVITIGLLLVVILSFVLKNPVSAAMYKFLPFASFSGLFENLTVLNIVLYEIIAFVLVFGILSTILIMLIRLSSIIERLIKATVIFEIPSKILGLILGLLEFYVIAFVIIFIISEPVFKIQELSFIDDSVIKPIILEKTPIISDMTKSTTNTFKSINSLVKDRNNITDSDFNCKALNAMIDNKFLDKESAKYLYEKGKINTKCGIGD